MPMVAVTVAPSGHAQFLLPRGDAHGAEETGGIAEREQLLRIGAVAAGAAELLRHDEVERERARRRRARYGRRGPPPP